MKKILYRSVLLVSILATISCSDSLKEESEFDNKKACQTITMLYASLANEEDASTRTVRKLDGKIYWNPGDAINVFFGSDKGKFTSSNTEDAAKASFNGSITISSVIGMNEGEDDDNCVWGLYPYHETASFDGTYVYTSLSSEQMGKAGSFADDLFITLAKSNSFKLSFYNVLAGIKFSIQKEGVKKVIFSGNDGEILTGDLKLKFGEDERPVVSEITNGKTSVTLTPDGGTFTVGEYYYIVFAPTTFSKGFTLSFQTATEEGEYTYNKSITFPRNMFGTLTNADKDVTYSEKNDYEYVDLGLSVKWATCNVGANMPEGYGDYYAWGETATKSFYEWKTYKYGEGDGDENPEKLTKYCNNSAWGYNGYSDDKTVLEPTDDVAHVKWGGNWRIPTVAEWDELLNDDNCTWSSTTQNGVRGIVVTSKKTGYTNKSIFLPYAGYKFDQPYSVNSVGYYWSSSLYDSYQFNAWNAVFVNGSHNKDYRYRDSGISVRPVCP